MKELYIRHYLLDGPANFRDLGGFLTKENKITKFNLLYRSDKFDAISEKDIETFKKIGLKTIIDFRSDQEVQKYPDIVPEFMEYHRILLMEKNLQGAKDGFYKSMKVRYEEIIKYDQDNIKKIFELIDEKLDEGGIVFHCSAGKDRTGVTAALLLMLFGVQNSDIVADYETSFSYNEELYKKRFADRTPEQIADMWPLLQSERENMVNLLKIVNSENIEEYLLSCGIKQETLDSIKSKCLRDIEY